ncbi:TPA: condensation domain-containing protein, partial [Staphylococcus aureus]
MKYTKLSYAQNEIMELEQYYENTSVNNISGLIILPRSYTYSEINDALNSLVEYNENYRINIVKKEAEYKQIINKFQKKRYGYIDFKNKKLEYKTWIKSEANRNIFELNKDLYEFKIIKLPNGEKGLFLKQHHLISDGWTMTLVINFLKNELTKKGNKHNKHSYFESINNEEKYECSEKYLKDEQFWLKKIEKINNNGMFESKNDNSQSKRISFDLSNEESRDIFSFCKEKEISLNHLFSAAYLLIKKSVTHSEVNSIGIMVHNRNSKEEKNIPGLYSRVLPLIIDADNNLTVQEFLKLIKNESFNLLKHRKYPLSKITENSDKSKQIIDVAISFQNTSYDDEFLEKGFSDKWFEKDTNNFPLSISISNRSGNGNLTLDFDYQIDKINVDYIKIIKERIVNIIKKFIEKSEETIDKIEVYTESERDLVLNKFNDTKKDDLPEETIVELFEKQVEKTPNNIAIVYGGEKLTYKELNNKANQLGHKLRSLGVKPNDLIGLMTDRRVEMIIGIYGILKAGGAYVPIDPNYPEERKKYILKDSKVKLLLTDQDMKIETYKEKIINLTKPTVYENRPSYNLTH